MHEEVLQLVMKANPERVSIGAADLERHKGYKNPQSGTRLYD